MHGDDTAAQTQNDHLGIIKLYTAIHASSIGVHPVEVINGHAEALATQVDRLLELLRTTAQLYDIPESALEGMIEIALDVERENGVGDLLDREG